MTALKIDIDNCRYKAMIGTGGIGSGQFFLLSGDHTLGREESRSGRFIDRKDYCKLHIIAHYVQTLLGPEFPVFPIGKVGDDQIGDGLFDEMKEAGMNMKFVERSPGGQTLYSFCFIYPDGGGGNLTTDDSASSQVDAAFISKAGPEFSRFAGQGIALTAPEAPLEARERLLELATEHTFFRAASFTSEEMSIALESGMLRKIDLLAINLDEAAAAAGKAAESDTPLTVVEAAIKTFNEMNPEMQISITNGRNGSWSWDGVSLNHTPAHAVQVVSTAGAGDAYFAGLIVGLTAGLSLPEAQQLGTLVGGVSVTSPHTINKELNREALRRLAKKPGAGISQKVHNLLEDES